jgi:hypothetical protein
MSLKNMGYSPETRGDLEEYLRRYSGSMADNVFFGPEYFFIIKDKGWMRPNDTMIRVNRSPIPDEHYFVNSDFLLESNGPGRHNMSCVGAQKGVYDPKKVLKNMLWSIYGLNLTGRKF